MKTISNTIETITRSIFQIIRTLTLITGLLLFVYPTIFGQSERTTPRIATSTVNTSNAEEHWQWDTLKFPPVPRQYELVTLNANQEISFPIVKGSTCAWIKATTLKDVAGNSLNYKVDQISLNAINRLSDNMRDILKITVNRAYNNQKCYFAIFWDMNGCNAATARMAAPQPTTVTTTIVTDFEVWLLNLKQARINYTDAVALPVGQVNTKASGVKTDNTDATKPSTPIKGTKINSTGPAISVPTKNIEEN